MLKQTLRQLAATLTCTSVIAMAALAVTIPAGTSDWEELFPTTQPSARSGHAMANLGGDKVLLYGGWEGFMGDSEAVPVETWVYDLSENTWTSMNPATQPGEKIFHSMTTLGGDKVLLFGGINMEDEEELAETWIYDLSENSWTQMTPASSPPAVAGCAMATLSDDHVLLFGGLHEMTGIDETWLYDLEDDTWTQMEPDDSPSPRGFHAMATLRDGWVILFGGQPGFLIDEWSEGETWLYDLDEDVWEDIELLIQPDQKAYNGMATVDYDRVLLFGGIGPADIDNETWTLETFDENWTLQDPATVPDPRAFYAMANIGDGHVLLFGGTVDGSDYGDTWVYQALARPGITVTPVSGLITTEAGGTAAFEISADTAPTDDVFIPLESSDTTEGIVPEFVALPAGSTDPVTVIVTGVDDAIIDGDIAYTVITGEPESDDPDYDDPEEEEDVANVALTNWDMDIPCVEVQGDGETIENGDGSPSRQDDTDFGATQLETPVSKTFTIRNRGSVDLQLTGVPLVELIGSDDFSVTDQPSTTISAGGSDTFTVRCRPTNLGDRTAIVSIHSSDPDDDPYEFTIRCTGGHAPEIRVQGNAKIIPYEDDSPSETKGTVFTLVSDTSITHTFIIENRGNDGLLLHNGPNYVTVDHPRFIISRQPDVTIDEGEATTFDITFFPGEDDYVTATVSIWNSDEDKDPFTYQVIGSVAGATAPTLHADAGSDQIVLVGAQVFLDGGGSYDGTPASAALASEPIVRPMDVMSYSWEFTVDQYVANSPVLLIPAGSRCRESCQGFDTQVASFVADLEGEYTITLQITNSEGEIATDEVTVTAVLAFGEPTADFHVDRILYYPNPFSSTMTFGFDGEGVPDLMTVSILDLQGHPVWSTTVANTGSVLWDGRTEAGERLPNGGYIAMIMIKGNGQIFTKQTLVFIRR